MRKNQHGLELNDQSECSHTTPESQHTVQLMQVTTKLFMDAPQGTIAKCKSVTENKGVASWNQSSTS